MTSPTWTSGYVSELNYIHGYYEELNTNRAQICLINKGLQPPRITHALELGFGQGVSINIHSAASEVVWTGTDFNPAQVNFARRLSLESGAAVSLRDDSFKEFMADAGTPEFQFIALHGIWSWVSDENRKAIVDIIRTKLEVGGVVYLSYNTLPGWASFSPMRQLMLQHTEALGSPGEGIISRIDKTFQFSEDLFKLNPRYLLGNPQTQERVAKLKTQNRHYLAHEFFNKDWHPMYFGEVEELLCEAKLQFAASASFADHVDTINLTADQIQFLKDIPDTSLRETVRDFLLNRQFRKDYWVKGPMKLAPLERAAELRKLKVVMKVPLSETTLQMKTGLGEVNFDKSIYQPIIDLLSDHSVRSVGDIEGQLASTQGAPETSITLEKITQALILLLETNQVALAQADDARLEAQVSSAALNKFLLDKAKCTDNVDFLASPVTGGGVNASRLEMLFLGALTEGIKEPQLWAEFAWRVLSSQGHRLVDNGVPIESDQKNLEELSLRAKAFADKRLVTFRTLGII